MQTLTRRGVPVLVQMANEAQFQNFHIQGGRKPDSGTASDSGGGKEHETPLTADIVAPNPGGWQRSASSAAQLPPPAARTGPSPSSGTLASQFTASSHPCPLGSCIGASPPTPSSSGTASVPQAIRSLNNRRPASPHPLHFIAHTVNVTCLHYISILLLLCLFAHPYPHCILSIPYLFSVLTLSRLLFTLVFLFCRTTGCHIP